MASLITRAMRSFSESAMSVGSQASSVSGEDSRRGVIPERDMLDEIERGASKELLFDETATAPSSRRKWNFCYVTHSEKKQFWMHSQDTHKVMLTAKREGAEVYISQYKDFPTTFAKTKEDAVSRSESGASASSSPRIRTGFCAVVRMDTVTGTIRMYKTGCDLCDSELYTFTCGPGSSETKRQLIAVVRMRSTTISGTDIAARAVSVDIPPLDERGNSIVWCPRTLGRAVPPLQVHQEYRLKRSLSASSSEMRSASTSPRRSTLRKRTSSMASISEDGTEKVKLKSKLPTWNAKVSSLVLGFKNKRVSRASSKNFLMVCEQSPDHVVFQFGKSKKSATFNLDFRNPVSPLQAFGIAVTSFMFKDVIRARQKM